MKTLRIFGLDPGSNTVGYSLLLCRLPGLQVRDYKVIEAGTLKAQAKFSNLERVGFLHNTLFSLLTELNVDLCIVEKAFVGPNPKTALVLGQARGGLLTAMSRLNLPIVEISSTAVKKTVAGNGLASKAEVASSLFSLLGFNKGKLSFDVSDAVAIALAYGLSFISSQSFLKKS